MSRERPMPYRCQQCRGFFSVRTGTFLHGSKLPLQKWAVWIHLMSKDRFLVAARIEEVSSIRVHRDLGITRRTAWSLVHRIRAAYIGYGGDSAHGGPAELGRVGRLDYRFATHGLAASPEQIARSVLRDSAPFQLSLIHISEPTRPY